MRKVLKTNLHRTLKRKRYIIYEVDEAPTSLATFAPDLTKSVFSKSLPANQPMKLGGEQT